MLNRKRVFFSRILGLSILVFIGMRPQFAMAGHSCSGADHVDSKRTVHVSWDENTEADLVGYRLYYGEQSGQYEEAIEVGNQTTCMVGGLDPGAAYYFAVTAYDADQKESLFSGEGFSSGSGKDETAPTVSDIRVTGIASSSAIIVWSTDEPARGSLEYGTTASFDHTAYSPTETNLHRVTLDGLAPSATYFYRIATTDASGNTATRSGADLAFTTAPPPPPPPTPTPTPTPTPRPTSAPTPLLISSIRIKPVGPFQTRASITWETNRPATSRLEYGATTSYGRLSEQKSPHVTEHRRAIRRLRPRTTFYFRVVSEDSGGNVATESGKFKIVLLDGKPVIRR